MRPSVRPLKSPLSATRIAITGKATAGATIKLDAASQRRKLQRALLIRRARPPRRVPRPSHAPRPLERRVRRVPARLCPATRRPRLAPGLGAPSVFNSFFLDERLSIGTFGAIANVAAPACALRYNTLPSQWVAFFRDLGHTTDPDKELLWNGRGHLAIDK